MAMFIKDLYSNDFSDAIIYTIHEIRSVAVHWLIIQLGHNCPKLTIIPKNRQQLIEPYHATGSSLHSVV